MDTEAFSSWVQGPQSCFWLSCRNAGLELSHDCAWLWMVLMWVLIFHLNVRLALSWSTCPVVTGLDLVSDLHAHLAEILPDDLDSCLNLITISSPLLFTLFRCWGMNAAMSEGVIPFVPCSLPLRKLLVLAAPWHLVWLLGYFLSSTKPLNSGS